MSSSDVAFCQIAPIGELSFVVFGDQAIYLMTDYEPLEVCDAPESRTQDIFDKMDINHDGVLSKDEFIRGCLNDDRLYKLLACSNENDHEQQQLDD